MPGWTDLKLDIVATLPCVTPSMHSNANLSSYGNYARLSDLSAVGGVTGEATRILLQDVEKRERKREQNRIAQRNYRRNQKQRIQALEAALGQLEPADTILASPPTSNAAETTFDLAPVSPPSSAPQNPSPCDDQSLWAFDPSWKRTHQQTSPEILGEQGRTALHLAVNSGNESITRLLLERGADIAKQDHNGSTALHLACERGSEVLTRLLLEKLADPNERDFLGRTALFKAVAGKNEAVVKVLLEASADVNTKDSLGTMALHLAVESGSEPLVLLLLQHGADINA